MTLKVQHGNAARDSSEFGQWLVGDFDSWATKSGATIDVETTGLRNTADVEMKWAFHPKGECRGRGWAPATGKQAISFLLRGTFGVRFRDPRNADIRQDVVLREFGDYVMWVEDVEHTWHALEDSLVLTVRWKPGSATA